MREIMGATYRSYGGNVHALLGLSRMGDIDTDNQRRLVDDVLVSDGVSDDAAVDASQFHVQLKNIKIRKYKNESCIH